MNAIVTVDFRNDTLFAVERDDGVFVAVKPICETLGIAWNKQLERLKRDPILAEGMTMTVIPSPSGPQETTCLKLDLVNGWLFTIDESRVKDEETRQRVLTYKRECYRVLYEHFHGARGPVAVIPQPIDPRELALISEHRLLFGREAAARLWIERGLPMAAPALPDAEAIACLTHLLDAWTGAIDKTVREALNAAFRAKEGARNRLASYGLGLQEDGFTVFNVHPFLAKTYEGTRWERPFEYLRRLPGAKSARAGWKLKPGEGTYLPSTYIDFR
jgi:hypothetical protein